MRKNIALLVGGDSSEYVISIKSGEQISQILDKEKFNVYQIHVKGKEWDYFDSEKKAFPINKDDFSLELNSNKIKFDCALILIHGTPGENGILQAYFDLVKIPCTTCSFFTSALTFNKFATKLFVKEYGVTTAKSVIVRKNVQINTQEIVKTLGLPCFVKPNNGGSSFATTKVKEEKELVEAINLAIKEDGNEAIIEEFIKGTELTNGVYKIKNEKIVLPITEIVSSKEFFDYEAKYTDGVTQEITPARVSQEIETKCKALSSKIYDILDCKGVTRIDYILRDNELYFLEINTVPGMSKNSIVPQQVRAMGGNMTDFYTQIIENSLS